MAILDERVETVERAIVILSELLLTSRRELEELRRENRQTRRIWIAIARKQELFDDEEFLDVFGEE